MMRGLVCALVCFALSCGGTIRVRTQIVHPPRLEIAAGEHITIVHAGEPFTTMLAAGLERGLEARGIDAEVQSTAAPSALRGTLLVLTVLMSSAMRTEWTTRPESVCGAYGCYIRNVSQPIDMPYLVASFEARLEDAETRAVLERTSGTAETVGTTGGGQNQRRLVAQVLAKILDALEPHSESLRLSFESIDDDALDRAFESVEEGDFAPAREALEARITETRYDDETRARLAYDLALVLAYDPASRARPGAFARALEHAELAVRLDPTSRHITMLERVRAIVSETEIDAARRLRVPDETVPGVPPVPDAYRGTIPNP